MPAETLASPHGPLVRRLVNLLGWLCVATTLALSAPGVVATAKGEPATSEVRGPSCNVAENAGEGQVVMLTRMMEQLRANAAAGNDDPSNEVIPLDNRGFSYPVVPPSELPPAPGRP
jgi:hypothetical protein